MPQSATTRAGQGRLRPICSQGSQQAQARVGGQFRFAVHSKCIVNTTCIASLYPFADRVDPSTSQFRSQYPSSGEEACLAPRSCSVNTHFRTHIPQSSHTKVDRQHVSRVGNTFGKNNARWQRNRQMSIARGSIIPSPRVWTPYRHR
jgi:hypothetical protein